jgi:hypothetical protein
MNCIQKHRKFRERVPFPQISYHSRADGQRAVHRMDASQRRRVPFCDIDDGAARAKQYVGESARNTNYYELS